MLQLISDEFVAAELVGVKETFKRETKNCCRMDWKVPVGKVGNKINANKIIKGGIASCSVQAEVNVTKKTANIWNESENSKQVQ